MCRYPRPIFFRLRDSARSLTSIATMSMVTPWAEVPGGHHDNNVELLSAVCTSCLKIWHFVKNTTYQSIEYITCILSDSARRFEVGVDQLLSQKVYFLFHSFPGKCSQCSLDLRWLWTLLEQWTEVWWWWWMVSRCTGRKQSHCPCIPISILFSDQIQIQLGQVNSANLLLMFWSLGKC